MPGADQSKESHGRLASAQAAAAAGRVRAGRLRGVAVAVVDDDVDSALGRVGLSPGERIRLVLAPPATVSTAPSATAGRVPLATGHDRDAEIAAAGDGYRATVSGQSLDMLLAGCAQEGVVVESVTTADYAWANAAASLQARPAVVAVSLAEAAELRFIVVEDGRPTLWRRLPAEASSARIEVVLESIRPRLSTGIPSILPLGPAEFRTRLVAAGEAAGWTIALDRPELEGLGQDALAIAAAFGGTGPRFVPRGVVRRERLKNRRRALGAVAAALLCVLAAGAFEILDLRAEMATVEVARAAIAGEVATAMDHGADASSLAEVVAGVEVLRASTPRWTTLLGILAEALPRETVVRTLQTRGDSVYLELEGADVAASVDRVREIPWWTGLRAVGAVATDVGDDGTITERLTLAARVTWEPLNEAERP